MIVLQNAGIVKVSAYEYANSTSEPPVPPEKVDMLIYPAGVSTDPHLKEHRPHMEQMS
jgi:hypothetical protein